MSTTPTVTRLLVGVRLLVLSGAVLAAIGFAGRQLGWILLTTTLGPTAYVFLAHPATSAARMRNAIIGHAAAVGCGLGSLAVFGLWHHPSVVATSSMTPDQVGAQALAVGCTLFLLAALKAHHAPAGATTLLIASGIAHPGKPLIGLVVGLAMLIAVGPLLAKLPVLRSATARQGSEGSTSRERSGSGTES